MAVISSVFQRSGATAGSFSFAFDATGADCLIVAVAFDDDSAHTFAGVTYDSVTMTPSGSVENATGRSVYTFRLLAPTTGSNTLLIDWDGSSSLVNVGVLALSGVNQTTPITGSGTAGANGASISIPTVTSTANDTIYAFGYLNNEAITDVTEGAEQTLVDENGLTGGVFWLSEKAGAATSQSMSWTNTSQSYGVVALSVAVVSTTVSVTGTDFTYGDSIPISTTGLGTITTATLTDANLNVFDISVTNDTTLAIPALTGGLDACLYGLVTLTVGDGTDTAATTRNLNPPAGYTLTTLTGLTGTPTYIDKWATAPAEVGDQVIKNESRLTLNVDGSYSVTGDTGFTEVVYVTSSTGGEVTQITYNFAGDGSVSVGGSVALHRQSMSISKTRIGV